jgi:cardiolipin synthase A/B
MNKLIILLLLFHFTLITFADTLLIEPNDGRTPILNAIQKSQSIDLVMYGFTDPAFLDALIDAKNKGKNIHILLEPLPYKNADENIYVLKHLKKANISLLPPNPDFQLTHQKTFIFDHKKALIMTLNLTRSSFQNQRNFGIWVDDPLVVSEIETVLQNDAKHQNTYVTTPRLVWSPDNAREKILNFIHTAQSSIVMYAQDVSDYQIVGALSKAARRGVNVELLIDKYSPQKRYDFLKKSNVHLCFEHPYQIHAKVIIIDQKEALLGSINFTKPSLNKNRELSVITKDPLVIQGLLETFYHDWQCGKTNITENITKMILFLSPRRHRADALL